MNVEKMTERVADGLNAAYSRALHEHNTQTAPEHMLAALLDQDRGIAPDILEKAGADPKAIGRRVEDAIGRLPRLSGSGADSAQVTLSPELARIMSVAENEAKGLQDDYTSVEHVLLAMAQSSGEVGRIFREAGLTKDKLLACAARRARQSARDDQGSRGDVQVARALRPRPHARGGARQARSGHRARRGDPAHRPSAFAAHEKQPGADRRSRRRQDRDRRGPRAAHRARRRSRGAEEQAHRLARHGRADRRREVSRRVRRAPQGRAQGRRRLGRPDHPVRRRAAHRGRRRQGRGRDGRGQPAQTDARARRAAHDRRDDARRVSQVHREGRGAGAPLPADHDRSAQRRGHDLDPARPEGKIRGAPRRAHQGRRARCGRDAEQPLHHRSLPPDKAIDLVDESAAKLRTEIDSMPQELDEVSRRVLQLEIEREALRKENDDASRRRLEQLEKELADAARGPDAAAHALGRGEERRGQAALAARSDRADEGADRTGRASVRSQQGRRAALRHAAESTEGTRGRGTAPRPARRRAYCRRKRSTKTTSPA